MEDLDALLNTGAVPQDERTADFIAESRANRSFCYETAERGALRVAEDPEAFKAYLDVQSRFLRYTPNNVLLILEQKPEARKLGNMAYWRDKNTFVKRAERSRPVFLLEPGKEYRREDNTIGQYYNARKLYDISQTTLAPSEWGLGKTYGDRQRIQALISRTPAAIHTVEKEPEGAVFVPKEHSILVQKGMGQKPYSGAFPGSWPMQNLQTERRDTTGSAAGFRRNVSLISYVRDTAWNRKDQKTLVRHKLFSRVLALKRSNRSWP